MIKFRFQISLTRFACDLGFQREAFCRVSLPPSEFRQTVAFLRGFPMGLTSL